LVSSLLRFSSVVRLVESPLQVWEFRTEDELVDETGTPKDKKDGEENRRRDNHQVLRWRHRILVSGDTNTIS
jgi:hypothetical protein